MSQFTCSNYPMSCLCGPNRLMNKGGEKREREREEDRVNNRQEAEGREKKAQYCIQFTLTNPIPKRALRLRLGQAWCNNDTLQLQLQQQNGSNFAQTKGMGKPREHRERGREGGTHTHTFHWWTRISIRVCAWQFAHVGWVMWESSVGLSTVVAWLWMICGLHGSACKRLAKAASIG